MNLAEVALIDFDSLHSGEIVAAASSDQQRFARLSWSHPCWLSKSRAPESSPAATVWADWAHTRDSCPAHSRGTRRSSRSQRRAWPGQAAERSRWDLQSTLSCWLKEAGCASWPVCCRCSRSCGSCLLVDGALISSGMYRCFQSSWCCCDIETAFQASYNFEGSQSWWFGSRQGWYTWAPWAWGTQAQSIATSTGAHRCNLRALSNDSSCALLIRGLAKCSKTCATV